MVQMSRSLRSFLFMRPLSPGCGACRHRCTTHLLPRQRIRLVFATDYHDGLFLMADEMHAAWRKLLEQERGGQLYLFDATELEALRGATIQDKVFAELQVPIDLQDLLIRLIRKHGIAHTTGEYNKAIKEREGTMFSVARDPAKTPTGRPSLSMDYNKVRIIVGTIPQARLLLRQRTEVHILCS